MAELEHNGFSAKKLYYEAPGSVAAHPIRHRKIVVGGSEEQGTPQNIDNMTGGNGNGFYWDSVGVDNNNIRNASICSYNSDTTMAGGSLFLKGRITNENY